MVCMRSIRVVWYVHGVCIRGICVACVSVWRDHVICPSLPIPATQDPSYFLVSSTVLCVCKYRCWFVKVAWSPSEEFTLATASRDNQVGGCIFQEPLCQHRRGRYTLCYSCAVAIHGEDCACKDSAGWLVCCVDSAGGLLFCVMRCAFHPISKHTSHDLNG